VERNNWASVPTEDALRASNERMGETIRYLVGEVEALRARVANLERYVYQHTHTVGVTYADYDGGVPTNRTATTTVTSPR